MGAGAIIGAVIAGTTYAAGSTFFGATLLASAITGASLGRVFDRPGSSTYGFGKLDNTRGQKVSIPVTYGRVKVAGNIIYHRLGKMDAEGKKGKELYMVIGLGEGPIESVEDVRVNDEPITSVKGYVEHHVRLGSPDQSPVSWVDTNETWPNTAYLAVKFNASEDLTMTPTITCVVKGRKIRSWSGSSWVAQYSNNPTWCILDLLTNERYGVGIKERYIDLESFKAEALYCDELVDDGKGGQEPRFRLDYNVDFQRSSLDLIDEILSTFRAYVLYSDGKLRLQIEKSQMPVQAFTMDNIVADSFSYSKASLKQIPNRVRVEWIDPEANWEQASIPYDNEVDQEERGDVEEMAVALYGVTRSGQAGREARWYHDSWYMCNTFCEFRVGIDSLHCEAGDVIKVSHDVPGWVEKQFRILEIQEEENDEMVLRCREYNSAIYHDRGSVYTQGRATELPNPSAPPSSVLNLTLIEEHKQLGDGTWIPQIKVEWEEPDGITWRAGNVWLSSNGGANWQFVNRVEGTDLVIDVGGNGAYLVKVVSENYKGTKEDFGGAATANITILGKRANPSNVQWADCFFVESVELNWLPVPERDIAGYEVRTQDDNWGARNEHLVYRGSELRHVFAPSVRNYSFYIRAYDRQGNYSKQSGSKSLSLPMPPAPQQPKIEEYFTAIKVGIVPVDSPTVKGYKLNLKNTKTGIEEIIPFPFATTHTHSAASGTNFTVQVSAFDILGEGPKSEPLQATTTALSEIDIPEDIIGPSKLTESLRSDIDLSKLQSGDALQRIGEVESVVEDAKGRLSSAEDEIQGAKGRLASAEGEISSAKGRLDDAEGSLSTIDGKLTTQENKITNIEGELGSKVSSTEFDTLAGTVSSHSTQISQNATAIQSKAEKSEVNTLAGSVSDLSVTVTQTADALELKAEQSEVDTLSGTVTSQGTAITQNATAITSVAEKSTTATAIATTTATYGGSRTSIAVTALPEALFSGDVILIVDKVTLNKYKATVSANAAKGATTISINSLSITAPSGSGVHLDLAKQRSLVKQTADEITAAVNRITTAEGTVATHGTTLMQHATAIEAKAEKSTVDTLTGRVETAEGEISAQAGQIALKATASEVYTKTQVDTELAKRADKGIVDGLAVRLTDAEVIIDAHSGAITQKAERTEVYTKSETDGKIDSIQVGGRNLVRNSREIRKPVGTNRIALVSPSVGLEEGTYTISLNYSIVPDGTPPNYFLLYATSGTVSVVPDIGKWNGSLRFTFTVTSARSNQGLYLYADDSSNKSIPRDVVFQNIKVEKGNKATDWTSAPEDMEAEIAKKVDNVTYTNKVGELTTSIDGISGRVSSTETNISTLTGEVTTVKANVASLDIKADGIQSTVSSLGTTVGAVSSQVTQLADEYTVKMQETKDGYTIAAGFGMAKDDKGNFYFGVIADKFRIFAVDTHGNVKADQAVFALDTQTQKLYLLADLISDGTIQARHLESESVKTMLVQAGVAYLDETNTLHLKADRVTVGRGSNNGLVMTKPKDGKLWHFDTSLHSTDGIKPLPGAAATLRPNEGRFGGAVAVEEATENLVITKGWTVTGNQKDVQFPVPPPIKPVISSKVNGGDGYQRLLWTNGLNATLKNEDSVTISAWLYVKGNMGRFNCQSDDTGQSNRSLGSKDVGHGWHFLQWTWINSTGQDVTLLRIRLENGATSTWENGDNEAWGCNYQVETKPFSTSFVDGSRPAGSLAYANLLQRQSTISFWWKKNHFITSGYEMPFRVANSLLEAIIRKDYINVAGAGVSINTPLEIDTWYMLTLVLDLEGSTKSKLYLNGERKATSGGLSNYMVHPYLYVGCGSTSGAYAFNGLLDEFLILPYAATDEEIKAWYEMGQPFYDPEGITTYQNDGGYIEIDRQGLRMVRSSDGKTTINLDLKTGNADYDGELSAQAMKTAILEAGGIKADWYEDIRNTLVYNYLDSLDATKSLICDFYIPSETTNIVSVKLSAKGLPFRAYARGAASGGGTTATSSSKAGHVHGVTLSEIPNRTTSSDSAYGLVGGGAHGHSHTLSVSASETAVTVVTGITTSVGGSHSHSVSGSADSTSHSHSISVEAVSAGGLHSHPASSSSSSHSHSVSGSTGSDGSHTGHVSNISTSNHKHSVSVSLSGSVSDNASHIHSFTPSEHNHTFSYYMTSGTTETSDAHDHSVTFPSHVHDLVYGIYESTSPTGVRVRVDNGSGWGAWHNLSSSPNLATELDFQGVAALKVTGTGWKKMEFSSTTLGRINANLIAKVDITA